MNKLNNIINKLVIVNYMDQLAYATVPKYLVKHYSRYFCEGDFLIHF